ncbi:MAG: DUF3592 domain-containing protein [Blastocatellales bacterium]
MDSTLPWVKIGIGFGALIVVYAWLQAFHRKGRAIGTITEITTRPGADNTTSEVPVITFRVGETSYSFQPSLVLYGETRRNRIGLAVPVAYNRDNPKDAEIATPVRRFLSPVIVTVLYGIFIYLVITGVFEI